MNDTGMAVLRIGMALVFLWFGIAQVTAPQDWTDYIPSWVPGAATGATTHVLINGGIEIIMAVMLLVGVFVRPVAALAALHMLVITIVVGYNAVGVRDAGLFFGILAVALSEPDRWTLLQWRKTRASN